MLLFSKKKRNHNYTSRPASVNKTVPRPPAVSHFWVEKPSNSMNKDTAATHTAVYTALPANWNPICQESNKLLFCRINTSERIHYNLLFGQSIIWIYQVGLMCGIYHYTQLFCKDEKLNLNILSLQIDIEKIAQGIHL